MKRFLDELDYRVSSSDRIVDTIHMNFRLNESSDGVMNARVPKS